MFSTDYQCQEPTRQRARHDRDSRSYMHPTDAGTRDDCGGDRPEQQYKPSHIG